jgi:hypothetical protein
MGPIGQALDKREFDEVVLLCNYHAADAREFEAWVGPRTSAKLSVRVIALKDPTDYLAIYQAVEPLLGELTGRKGVELALHLSPGTPAMGAAAWKDALSGGTTAVVAGEWAAHGERAV